MFHARPVGLTALALGLVLTAALPGSAAAGPAERQDSPRPGDTRGAKVVKAGWWWVANEPPPETGVLAAPQPPAPNVPKGAIPVGAIGGDPEKVSAIEVRLKAATGSGVRSFEMVLRESDEPGANANPEAARILACPVTELFWADGSAAAWKDQPSYDCESAAARGKRTKKGLWRFDLTEVATRWLAEGSTDSRSVVLVEDVEAPESFQVTFDGAKDEGVGLALRATPPPPSSSGGGGVVGGSTTGVGTGSGGGSSLGGGGGAPLGGGGSAPLTGSGADSGPVGDAAAGDAGEAGQEAIAPVAAALPAWYSGIPRPAFVLLPLALALAYLVMLSLGPGGRPVPTTGRHGVSRALERLRAGR